MHLSTMLSVLIAFFVAVAAGLEELRSVKVSAWPLSDATSQTLATIRYNSTHGIVHDFKAPKIPELDDIVRIGFHQASTNSWSGVATSASNFKGEKEKTVLLHLDSKGNVFHVGFRATDLSSARGGSKDVEKSLKVEVVPITPGPMVHLSKPVVLNAEGQVDGPPEKTFLQKYWWAIAAFLVFQLFMGGGGDKKE